MLVTVGLALSVTALVTAIWGATRTSWRRPAWVSETTDDLRRHIPNDRWLEIASRRSCSSLEAIPAPTRYGLIVRAGVENRPMVTALGIDVRKSFTLVFVIGGLLPAIAGRPLHALLDDDRPAAGDLARHLRVHRRRDRRPRLDPRAAVAAIVVGLVQQYANYYASRGRRSRVVLLLGSS